MATIDSSGEKVTAETPVSHFGPPTNEKGTSCPTPRFQNRMFPSVRQSSTNETAHFPDEEIVTFHPIVGGRRSET
jgi:hypothetical protein